METHDTYTTIEQAVSEANAAAQSTGQGWVVLQFMDEIGVMPLFGLTNETRSWIVYTALPFLCEENPNIATLTSE